MTTEHPMTTTARELPLSLTVDLTRATLEGRKVETRRPVKPQPKCCERSRWKTDERGRWYCGTCGAGMHPCSHPDGVEGMRSPLGAPGDLLYVRERARVQGILPHERVMEVCYEADGRVAEAPWPTRIKTPTIGHCLPNGAFKEAARLWLRVERVWVERVQEITEASIRAEGLRCPTGLDSDDVSPNYKDWYPVAWQALWDSIYARRGLDWDANPWVWACRFSIASTTGREGVDCG